MVLPFNSSLLLNLFSNLPFSSKTSQTPLLESKIIWNDSIISSSNDFFLEIVWRSTIILIVFFSIDLKFISDIFLISFLIFILENPIFLISSKCVFVQFLIGNDNNIFFPSGFFLGILRHQ